MFIGKYYHTVEDKGRVSLPKKFRDQVEEWVITRGLDGGLFVFDKKQFNQEIAELAQSSFTKKTIRDFTRLMANEAAEAIPDKTGRILIPEYLLERADIRKEVVIVGSISRIEIWDREKYHQYLDEISAQAEEIAEKVHDAT